MAGLRTLEFRRRLKELVDKYAGLTLEELMEGTDLGTRLRGRVEIDMPEVESSVFRGLREAFVAISDDPVSLSVGKEQLHEILRHFLGVKMDANEDVIADYLNFEDEITYSEFAKKWSKGPGRHALEGEAFNQCHYIGEFILWLYEEMGVMHTENIGRPLEPEDFATDPMTGWGMVNPGVKVELEFGFEPHSRVV